MEDTIRELEGLIESVKEQGLNPGLANLIGELINGYRTLEKHIGFYEKNGSYKARIVELEEQVEYLKHEVELRDATVERLMREKEELKNLANNTQWISPCYVAENYIAKEKVDNLLKELLRKLDEPCDDRWENDNKDYYVKIKAQINIIKQLKEG